MKEVFIASNENNIQTPYEILFKFTNTLTNINYLVYTDNTYDDDNDLNIISSRYKIENGKIVISPIKTDDEYDFVDRMIELEVGEK